MNSGQLKDCPTAADPINAFVAAPPVSASQPGTLSHFNPRKIILFVASLFAFVLAIQLMKEGARGMSPLIRDWLAVNSPANCLGFGWLLAYLVLSGSPVAAAALTFFDAGLIDRVGTFTMITGSRLGASFIVLFVGFIYTLRGHERRNSLSTGLLALMITWSVYLLGLAIGLQLLMGHTLDFIHPPRAAELRSIVNVIFDPITHQTTAMLPLWGVFAVGAAVIMISFSLFDQALPQIRLRDTESSQTPRLIDRPIGMFLLGAAVTAVSMSVSVSVSILVPLTARGYIRRESVIPYIMGANVTTMIDTLLATLLLTNASAFTIVFVEMVSVALVSLVILSCFFHPYARTLVRCSDWVLASNRRLGAFILTMFVIPVLLLFR